MSTLQRAFLSVLRHRVRSLLFIVLFSLVFTVLIAQAGTRSTLAHSSDALKIPSQPGVLLRTSSDSLDDRAIDEAAKVTGAQCTSTSRISAEATGIKPVTSENGPIFNGGPGSEVGVMTLNNLAHLSLLSDNILRADSSLISKASGTSGALNAGTALVHEELARANNLSPGSQVTLTREGKSVTLRVVGLISGQDTKPHPLPADRPENTFVVDQASAQTLAGGSRAQSAFCPLSDGANVATAVSKVQESVGSDTEVSDASAAQIRASKTLASVEKLLSVLFLCVIVLGTGVLALALVLQIRGRVHEIGIFTALGTPKKNIGAQLLIESAGLALIAAPISIFLGDWATRVFANVVAGQIGQPGASLLTEATAGNGAILSALALGSGVLALALLLALIPLMRRPTREILATAS